MREENTTSFLRGVSVVLLGDQRCVRSCGDLLQALGADVRTETENSGRPGLHAPVFEADVLILSSDTSAVASAIWSRGDPGTAQIICNITAFGVTGPLAGTSMPERLLQGVSGVAATTGYDEEPAAHRAPIIDAQATVYAASAIIAALHEKRRTGRGQNIDLSRFDVAINAILTFIPCELAGRTASRIGNRHPFLAPWNCFHAADGWLTICAPTNSQWERLCQAVGREDLCSDERFLSSSGRATNIEVIDHVIQSWTAQHTVTECVERLQRFGISCGPVAGAADIFDEPNLKFRDMLPTSSEASKDKGGLVYRCPIKAVRFALSPAVLSDSSRTSEAGSLWRTNDSDGPLRGLRVVELGSNTAGPLAAKQLAALGADVLKVESPAGDPSRSSAPFSPLGESFAFALSNTDKRGIVLDLKVETDNVLLHSILSEADVLIENWKPGSLERLGFGPRRLLSMYPRLTYCSISGFGHSTIYPGRPAYDIVIQGMSGLMGSTYARNAPLKSGISTSDLLAAQFGLLGILASTYESSGGVHLDISMLDCSVWATQALSANRTNIDAEVEILKVADGWVAIESSSEWQSRADEARTIVETLPRDAAVHWLERQARVSAAPVLSVREALAHPVTEARGLLKKINGNGEVITVLDSPIRLMSTPARVRRAMPPLGGARALDASTTIGTTLLQTA